MRKKTTNKWLLKIAITILVMLPFTISALVIVQLISNKCIWWDCVADRDFTVFDLGIPLEYFPDRSIGGELTPDRGIINAIDEAKTTIRWAHGMAFYRVLRFGSVGNSTAWFTSQTQDTVLPPIPYSDNTILAVEEILNQPVIVADRHRIECGYVAKDFRCNYEAQYEEFYIFFSSTVGRRSLDPAEFIAIVDYLENRMNDLMGPG